MEALHKLTLETNNRKGGELLGRVFELVKSTSDS